MVVATLLYFMGHYIFRKYGFLGLWENDYHYPEIDISSVTTYASTGFNTPGYAEYKSGGGFWFDDYEYHGEIEPEVERINRYL